MKLPDRYEVQRRIAAGGMASVWCAHDRMLGRDVAVKLLAEQFARDAAAIRRFMREARAAARLSGHPHVVTIFDVGESYDAEDAGRRAFIVMEYLAGGTVADALRVGEVTRELALRWLHQAAAALDYAHGRGVIHRDIKPPNFLLDCDRNLHVADFGIARLGTEDTITSAGQMLGTAAYLAPERALGHPATEASDRYSLAVVAFELLAGERPFTAEQFAAVARQHVDERPPRASSRNGELPSAVDAVLARGMAKRPEDRWPSAASMIDTLDLALTEGATVRRPFVTPSALRRRGPVLRGATAAAVGARAAAASARPLSPRRGRQIVDRGATRRYPRRGAALAALGAAAFAVGLAAGAGQGGSQHAQIASRSKPSATDRAPMRRQPARPKHHAHHPRPTATATAAAVTTPPQGAAALEARGHQLMTAGQYGAAIPILRQAVAAADPNSLTYAYALFDLGHSLRMAGDPRAAIPVLYKRLQIPNQTAAVRAELQAALLAVGSQLSSGGAAPHPGPPGHGHGKHKGPDGGGD